MGATEPATERGPVQTQEAIAGPIPVEAAGCEQPMGKPHADPDSGPAILRLAVGFRA